VPLANFPRTSHGRGAIVSVGTTIACAVASAAAVGVQASVSQSTILAAAVAQATAAGLAASVTVGTDNWSARSAGAVLANRLEDASTISAWTNADSTADHITRDTSVKVTGAAASARFAVLNSDGTASGQLNVPFGRSFVAGQRFWASYRVRAPAAFCYAPWPAPAETGHKLSILSHQGGSNTPFEIVTQVNYNANAISGYHQDGVVTAVVPDIGASTACSGSDFRWQPAIDRGANPLSGNDPDTGAAWSACAQDRRRYGGLYSAKSLGQFRVGLGDPLSGAVKQTPDEWITITQCVDVGTGGVSNTHWRKWVQREGQAAELVHELRNRKLGSTPEFDMLYLLPYVSQRVAGGRKVGSRTNNITGVEILVVGLDTPIGAGTLEYNASAQRFRWLGNGESFGTARGFSAANGILTINVTSGGATGSYVVLKVTPGSLSSSGIVTDTVTIADGRPDTQINYSDVIVKASEPIAFPDGSLPPGLTALEQQAAALSLGQSAQVTGVSGLGLFTGQQGSSGLSIAYASKLGRDRNGRKIHFIGCDHGDETLFLTYAEATHAVTEQAASVPWGIEASGTTSHGYHGTAYDPIHNLLFHRPYGVREVRRWDGGTTWGTLSYASQLFYSEASAGMDFFEEMGANGRLVVFQLENGVNGGLVSIDPITGTVTTHVNGSSSVLAGTGGPHCFLLYSPQHACVVFGGGNGSRKVWKMNAAGTITALDDIPAAITATVGPAGTTEVGNPAALPFVQPSNGHIRVQQTATLARVLNPSAASGSQWSNPGDTLGVLSANVVDSASAYGVAACTIYEYGVVAFLKNHSASQPAEFWLAKL